MTAVPLDQAERDVLTRLVEANGASARHISESVPGVGDLLVKGLVAWHPPRGAHVSLLPTPLGRERVEELQERSERSKRAAKKRRT